MNNTVPYKKIILIGCLISVVLGIFLHFAYDLSGNNMLVGLFTPINESVWEHLKLILVPFTLFSITFYFYTKQRFSNMFLVTLFGNIVGMFVIVLLYYLGISIFKEDNVVYNTLIFAVGMISSYLILYLGIYNKEFIDETKNSTTLGICSLTLLITLFILNTFSPIKLDITRDPISKTYGIEQIV